MNWFDASSHFMPLSPSITAQKMKFSIKDLFSKCDQIRSFLQCIPPENIRKAFVFGFQGYKKKPVVRNGFIWETNFSFSLEILWNGAMAKLLCSCQLLYVKMISGTRKTYCMAWNFQTARNHWQITFVTRNESSSLSNRPTNPLS